MPGHVSRLSRRREAHPAGVIRSLKVDGLRIRVRHLGAGRPVLLVHGLGVSTAYFSRLADRLAAETLVVAPDLPGWGASDRPRAPLDVAAAAEILAKIIVH